MTATALKLIERAVDFYIQQNLEVAANLYRLGYNTGGYTEEQFKERERYRAALELVRKELEQ